MVIRSFGIKLLDIYYLCWDNHDHRFCAMNISKTIISDLLIITAWLVGLLTLITYRLTNIPYSLDLCIYYYPLLWLVLSVAAFILRNKGHISFPWIFISMPLAFSFWLVTIYFTISIMLFGYAP